MIIVNGDWLKLLWKGQDGGGGGKQGRYWSRDCVHVSDEFIQECGLLVPKHKSTQDKYGCLVVLFCLQKSGEGNE